MYDGSNNYAWRDKYLLNANVFKYINSQLGTLGSYNGQKLGKEILFITTYIYIYIRIEIILVFESSKQNGTCEVMLCNHTLFLCF